MHAAVRHSRPWFARCPCNVRAISRRQALLRIPSFDRADIVVPKAIHRTSAGSMVTGGSTRTPAASAMRSKRDGCASQRESRAYRRNAGWRMRGRRRRRPAQCRTSGTNPRGISGCGRTRPLRRGAARRCPAVGAGRASTVVRAHRRTTRRVDSQRSRVNARIERGGFARWDEKRTAADRIAVCSQEMILPGGRKPEPDMVMPPLRKARSSAAAARPGHASGALSLSHRASP